MTSVEEIYNYSPHYEQHPTPSQLHSPPGPFSAMKLQAIITLLCLSTIIAAPVSVERDAEVDSYDYDSDSDSDTSLHVEARRDWTYREWNDCRHVVLTYTNEKDIDAFCPPPTELSPNSEDA